jgi:hypothetical protein
MYEGGNTIPATNALMDVFTYQVASRCYNLLTSNNSTAGWWIGGLGEFFYYTDVKSIADINLLGNYFKTKYNLSWIDI